MTAKDDSADFDTTWGILSSSLRKIHTKKASELSFEKLYRNAYDLVLKRQGPPLFERVSELEKEWLHNDVRLTVTALITPSLLFGGDRIDAMDETNERKLAGERFLLGLKGVWEDHQLCAGMITDVLMYLVRQASGSSIHSFIYQCHAN